MTRAVTRWGVLVALGLWAGGCGEPTQDPEDCTPSERFNQANELCEFCPVLRTPQCRPGCGFTIVTADDGCPEAACDQSCDLCSGPGSYFSFQSLRCEPCPEDTRFDPEAGRCVACPPRGAASEGAPCSLCGCQRQVEHDANGCVRLASCAVPCEDPATPGWTLDEDTGRCVMASP